MYNLELDKHLYIRNPQETVLGRKMIQEAIVLIDEMGFEVFTFKKLALHIESTEASIYRYFENKIQLLSYLVAYYWMWLELKISFAINHLSSVDKKLKEVLSIIANPNQGNNVKILFDDLKLHHIVARESLKSYFNKAVDQNNQEGYYSVYKRLCDNIAQMVLELNPTFLYPHALVTMLIEATHHQLYYAEHIPTLTNLNAEHKTESLVHFLECILFSALKYNHI